ncbi:hypothetical protein BD779DRAFT_1679860 [Infundibulicybe gibba]|nr:hypothetical protein BD779DRAFT_1679860 [Infundibulicybe gibba]
MTNAEEVQDHILNTTITIPLKQLIGLLPDMQKRLTNLTKTRREYVSQTVVAQPDPEDEYDGDDDANGFRDKEDVNEILTRYSSAVKDVSKEFYDQMALPLDVDGSRWSLKGINGGPVPLVATASTITSFGIPARSSIREPSTPHGIWTFWFCRVDALATIKLGSWRRLSKDRKTEDGCTTRALVLPSNATPQLSPWTSRALASNPTLSSSMGVAKRKYKPVDLKVCPIPSYMPDPRGQPLLQFIASKRLTQEIGLDKILNLSPFLRTSSLKKTLTSLYTF